jgi:hypothetical protein
MKRLAQTVLFVALLASLTLALPDEAHAQGTVNFDIDPEITGNSADTLGTVEDCYAVTCPSAECDWDGSSSFDGVSDYVIDVVVTGDTEAPTNYHASLNYDETKVHVAEPGTDPGIDLDGKMGGAHDLSEGPLPDSDGTFDAGAMYLMGGPGTAGSGTIARVGLDIGASGVVTFSLNAAPPTAYVSDLGAHAVTLGTGMLAINEACSAPVGGIAELPDVSGSAGRSYVALAGLAAGALVALAAGGWYARRRWLR